MRTAVSELAIDGKAVEGATVELTGDWFNNRMMNRGRNAIKETDSDGRFSFDRVLPGVRHHIQVRKEGFVKDGGLATVQRDGDRVFVKLERLRPIVKIIKPANPSTRGMSPKDALAMLSEGMPGKYKEGYPNGYQQYLLDAETWGRALREFARRHPGKEIAFQACTKILDTSMPHDRGKTAHAVRAIRRQATDILLKNFADRQELSEYVHPMVNAERGKSREVAQQLIDRNRHPEVAGVAASFGSPLPDPVPEDFPQWPRGFYGFTKVAVERLGYYYRTTLGLDFRALRLPIIISPFPSPGAASSYASNVFIASVRDSQFVMQVRSTSNPAIMYIKDCLHAINMLTHAESSTITRSSYNLFACAPTAEQLVAAIQHRLPDTNIEFQIDDQVADLIDSWPRQIDDTAARTDWNWQLQFTLQEMTDDFLSLLQNSIKRL